MFPFSRDTVSDEAIVPSLVTNSKDANGNEAEMTSGDNKRKSKMSPRICFSCL